LTFYEFSQEPDNEVSSCTLKGVDTYVDILCMHIIVWEVRLAWFYTVENMADIFLNVLHDAHTDPGILNLDPRRHNYHNLVSRPY
jgi:hypothetical protein